MNLCQKCGSFHEQGLKADFMAYDEGSLLFSHYEGAATISKKELRNFVPFSVWICEDCIKKEQKKFVNIFIFLGLFLASIPVFTFVPDDLKFFVSVFTLLFLVGLIYSIFLYFKPYRKMKEEDLSFLFTDTVTAARDKSGRSKHMLLSEFNSTYVNKKARPNNPQCPEPWKTDKDNAPLWKWYYKLSPFSLNFVSSLSYHFHP